MAFQIKKNIVTNFGNTWEGEQTEVQFLFSFPNLPFISEVNRIEDVIQVADKFKNGLVGYKIEEDTAPRPNKFRVTMFYAGAPEREQSGSISRTGQVSINGINGVVDVGSSQAVGLAPLLILLAVALAVAIIAGGVFWLIRKVGKVGFKILLFGGLAIVGGLVLVKLNESFRGAKALNRGRS